MDLFVINRYTDTNEDNNAVNRETLHLQQLKQKIEERKKSHKVTSDLRPDTITLKEELSQEEQISNDTLNENHDELDNETEKLKTDINDTLSISRNISEFKVLGSSDFENRLKVERVLPYWLSHAYSISKNLQTLACLVSDQNWLHSTLKTTLAREGIIHLFPVQEQVIPFILREHKQPEPFRPHDVCVSAPTGSGKTLSFVLPIIQILMNQVGHHVRALVVLPGQELAAQVAKVFRRYCADTGLRVALLSGACTLQKEQRLLMRYTETHGWLCTSDVVVCTAGRLVEHLHNTEGFSLRRLRFLVADEADRAADNVQNDWLYHLDQHIRAEMRMSKAHVSWSSASARRPFVHKLLFSATLSPDPELLERWALFQPKLFAACARGAPAELRQQCVVCAPEDKPLTFYHFFADLKWDKTLCFTNSAQSARRLTALLNIWGKGTLKVAELSAALDRAGRELVLRKFEHSEIDVIISTDALARGIDVPACNHVISYDPPRNAATYVHRVGRTGRAGRRGTAVTILLHSQVPMFREIMQSSGNDDVEEVVISRDVLENLLRNYEGAIAETKRMIHDEAQAKLARARALKRAAQSKPRKRKHN